MLVIEIALGIVLAWLIINHFDALVETAFTVIGSMLSVIFFPFKLVANVVVDTLSFLKQNFELIVKGLAVVALLFVAIFCVIGFVQIGCEAIPKYWKDNAPTVIVVGIIITGALLTLKDACVLLYKKYGKRKAEDK